MFEHEGGVLVCKEHRTPAQKSEKGFWCRKCIEHKPDEKLTATYFNFSPVYDLSDNEALDSFFSSFACQTCGDTLAGDRHYVSATIGKVHTNPREKLEICKDCYLYFFT